MEQLDPQGPEVRLDSNDLVTFELDDDEGDNDNEGDNDFDGDVVMTTMELLTTVMTDDDD